MARRSLRRFAPSFVVTIAACSSSGGGGGAGSGTNEPATDERERSWTELRNGQCEVTPDCTPPENAKFNPCNPPPPRQFIECPPELLPTQPPGTALERQDDGQCWVSCEGDTCDAPTPMRVRCPDEGAPAPTYEANLIIPAQTSYKKDDYEVRRNADHTCDLIQKGTTHTNIPCPPEIALRTAPGVVPVISSAHISQCYYGRYVVTCPKKFHTWH